MATVAAVGCVTSRYCSSAMSGAVARKVGGAIRPTASPTETSWPTSTPSSASDPAADAVTVSVTTLGFGCVTVPSAATTGSTGVSWRMTRIGSPAASVAPCPATSFETFPCSVAFTATSGSGWMLPFTVTSFTTVAMDAGTCDSTTEPVGTWAVSSVVVPKNAMRTSATAIAASTTSLVIGRIHLRQTPTAAPSPAVPSGPSGRLRR